MAVSNKILAAALCAILILTYFSAKFIRKNNDNLTKSIIVVKSINQPTNNNKYGTIKPSIINVFAEKKTGKTFINPDMILSQGISTHNIDINNEDIDSKWADETQEIIKVSLSHLPHIKPLSTNIICKSSICEVTGQIEQEVNDYQIEYLSKSISSTDYIDNNFDLNALPVKSIIEKSASQTNFKIEFSRVKK